MNARRVGDSRVVKVFTHLVSWNEWAFKENGVHLGPFQTMWCFYAASVYVGKSIVGNDALSSHRTQEY